MTEVDFANGESCPFWEGEEVFCTAAVVGIEKVRCSNACLTKRRPITTAIHQSLFTSGLFKGRGSRSAGPTWDGF